MSTCRSLACFHFFFIFHFVLFYFLLTSIAVPPFISRFLLFYPRFFLFLWILVDFVLFICGFFSLVPTCGFVFHLCIFLPFILLILFLPFKLVHDHCLCIFMTITKTLHLSGLIFKSLSVSGQI